MCPDWRQEDRPYLMRPGVFVVSPGPRGQRSRDSRHYRVLWDLNRGSWWHMLIDKDMLMHGTFVLMYSAQRGKNEHACA